MLKSTQLFFKIILCATTLSFIACQSNEGNNGDITSGDDEIISHPNLGCFPIDGQPAGSDLSLQLTPSRTVGVAPLLVHFDTDGTSSTLTQHPFSDLSYCWDFDDTNAGVFTTTGYSKNRALGPVAGHVFETPGTYTVTLVARDANDREAVSQVTITVEDPETVFAGSDTVCMSSSADFTGCPNAATQLTGSDIAEFQSYVATGRRLLLRRGDTFTSTGLDINVAGPGIVGAYGTGDLPLINTEGLIFNLSHYGIDNAKFVDWRIMDLEVDGGGLTTSSLARGHNLFDFLALRLRGRNLAAYVTVGNEGGDLIGIADCHFTDLLGGDNPDADGGGYNMAYLNGTRLVVLGNYYNNSTEGEHVMRIRFTQNSVVSSNQLGAANGPRLLLKLHALNWGTESLEYTERVVVSDNIFQGTEDQDWMVFIGPASDDEQRLRTILVERNEFVRAHTNIKVQLLLQAEDVTVRDNLFRSTVGGASTSINLETFASDNVASNIRIYHNSAVAGPGASDWVKLLDFRNSLGLTPLLSKDVAVFNNIVFANTNAQLMSSVTDSQVPNLTFGNNLITETSPFVAQNPATWTDFELTETSSARDGATLSYYSRWDFTRRTRDPVTPDVGALDYVAP